jgi:protease I
MKKFLIAAMAFLAIASFSLAEAKGKAAVLVIPADQVQDDELVQAKAALEKAGVKVTVAAPAVAPVKGMLGGSFAPDIAIAAIDPAKYDLIACIGGMGIFQIWADPAYLEKVQEFNNKGKFVAGTCGAAGVLANAGVLAGIKSTCYPDNSVISLLKGKGALYTGEVVTVSGRIVTGNGPEAAVPFGQALAKILM